MTKETAINYISGHTGIEPQRLENIVIRIKEDVYYVNCSLLGNMMGIPYYGSDLCKQILSKIKGRKHEKL